MNTNKILKSFTDLPAYKNVRTHKDGSMWLSEDDPNEKSGFVHIIEVRPVTVANRDQLEKEGWSFNPAGTYAWGYNGYEA